MIELPDLFVSVLRRNEGLHQAVRKTFDLFEPWLEHSGMPFFPGYTDHSPRHINDVLKTAASLISDKSRPLLTPEDIAVLCIAILLHDCGMHLTHDGFRSLLAMPQQPVVSGLGDRPWSELWNNFSSEVSRFNEDKLTDIFGTSEPYRLDQLNLENLSERDCLLIGEFVRRYHTRLAHEIAIVGVPTPPGQSPLRVIGLDHDFCDIAGLIARSHGMSIRQTFDYIKAKYGLIAEYRRIKIPFLMAVLRIADYIQVQSERAIASLLSVKELRSPISKQEWRNHFAVRDVSTRHDDPEALYLHATPADVKTYMKLDALFKDIQRELDETWATLGEVYGRLGELAALGLNIRRVRSNFESREVFSRSVPYFPVLARFKSSGPELLRLLVGPLYSNDYSIGIRELVQNAVDACRELADLMENRTWDGPVAAQPSVLVEIQELSDTSGWVIVTDTGIGMTLETVTEYFLSAGASYRNSETWKRQHLDASGSIRFMRGGRFGVGVLAAFLLGEEIIVSTRHITQSESIEFHAKIDDSNVQLNRGHSPVGTSIRIRVSSKDVLDRLRPSFDDAVATDRGYTLSEWNVVDWFAHAHPGVIYRWIGPTPDGQQSVAEFVRASGQMMPNFGAPTGTWRALANPEPYKAIYWRYARRKDFPLGADGLPKPVKNAVAVNGIEIGDVDRAFPDTFSLHESSGADIPLYSVSLPSLSILDPDALCPIDLQRNAIDFRRLRIDRQLESAVLRQYVRSMRRIAESCDGLSGLARLCKKGEYRVGVHLNDPILPFCLTHTGYALASPAFLEEMRITRLFIVDRADVNDTIGPSSLQPDEALLLRVAPYKSRSSQLDWFRSFWSVVLDTSDYRHRKEIRLLRSKDTAAWAMTHKKWALVNSGRAVAAALREPLSRARINDKFTVIWHGPDQEIHNLTSRLEFLTSALNPSWEIAAWCIGPEHHSLAKPSLLEKAWRKVIGGPVLLK